MIKPITNAADPNLLKRGILRIRRKHAVCGMKGIYEKEN